MAEDGDADKPAEERELAAGDKSVFIRWRPDRAAKMPEVVEAIERFDPG